MTRARVPFVVSIALIAVGCTAPPPPPLEVAVYVRSDPGKPLPEAQVQYSGQTIATTDASGIAKLTLHGTEGESFDVMIACPAGFQSPSQPVPIVLRRLADPGKVPQYDVRCPPTTRAAVIAVRADKGANLPVLYLGREIGRTDANGVATVLLHVRPQEAFDLMLATSGTGDARAEALRPQNPVATFTVKDQDDLFMFEPRFTVEAKKPVYRPPPPKGPVRIH
jgi:hypothetical protein